MKELFLIAAMSLPPAASGNGVNTSFDFTDRSPKYTQADAQFFRLMGDVIGKEPGSITVLPVDYNYHTLKYAMEFTRPGGILLIEIGDWLGFKLLLQMEGWSEIPIRWGKASIYQKPHRRNGASA